MATARDLGNLLHSLPACNYVVYPLLIGGLVQLSNCSSLMHSNLFLTWKDETNILYTEKRNILFREKRGEVNGREGER
jgi:hypothetical protein